MMEAEQDDSERIFNSTVREFVIFSLLIIILHFLSYFILKSYRKKIAFYASDYEDAVVYRVSFWMCAFSFGVSIQAALLLPISIISNEVLLFYPDNYYIQWLNDSLIQGFWTLAYRFTNISLFIFLPFAYFFTESQGFSGSRKGIKARVYETFSVFILVALLILGMIYILCAIIDYRPFSLVPLFRIWHYLPFLYSLISFLGVLILLASLPVGFGYLFRTVGELIVDQPAIQNVQTACNIVNIERSHILLRLKRLSDEGYIKHGAENVNIAHLKARLPEVERNAVELEKALNRKEFQICIVYPVIFYLLILITVGILVMVAQNMLALGVGIKTVPAYPQDFSLGINSLSIFGPFGAILESIFILYLWCSSVIGLYSLPLFRHLKPKVHDTSMVHIIGNCAVLLVLSSSLPVLARTLGITDFDLLGEFGRIHWLKNIYVVMFHNVVFALSTVICLVSNVTHARRQKILSKVFEYFKTFRLIRVPNSFSIKSL